MSKIFISYSHKDEKWVNELKHYLQLYTFKNKFEIWSDRDIYPGENWKDAIERTLKSSQVFILLISSNYLASDFMQNLELPNIIKAAEKKNAAIIPVIISSSTHSELLSKYQFVNSNETALNSLDKDAREKIFLEIAKSINSVLKSRKATDEIKDVDNHDKAFNNAISVVGGNSINISGTVNIFNIANEKIREGNEDE